MNEEEYDLNLETNYKDKDYKDISKRICIFYI